MSYPRRTAAHAAETASAKRLAAALPDTWVLRHVTERDYGLDCLIEPVVSQEGHLVGDLLAVQLKSAGSLRWRKSLGGRDRLSPLRGISTSTVGYWLGLPLPVFLCVHDRKVEALYFAPIKTQVRRRYHDFITKRTFSFRMRAALRLDIALGSDLLYYYYLQELAYPQFAASLADLLANSENYVDYFADRGRFQEGFEDTDFLRLSRLYTTIQTVARFTLIPWRLPPVADLIAKDREDAEVYGYPHSTACYGVLEALIPLFVQAIRRSAKIVVELERDYWEEYDPLLCAVVSQTDPDLLADILHRRLTPPAGFLSTEVVAPDA